MTNVLKKDLAQCNAEPNLIDKLFVYFLGIISLNDII